MNNWDQITIGEAVEIGLLEKPLDGNHGEIHPKGDDFVDSGIPFIMASDIKNGKVDLENCSYITNSQAQSLRKGFSINGDVLLTHKATLGEVALLKTNYEFVMLTPQVTYYRVKDKEKLNNSFLKYYFESSFFQKTLHNYAGGSTRAYIGITKQLDLPLILPPLTEQKAIANVLNAFDDKIELLQAQNKTLETISQTIFKEWFVTKQSPSWNKVKIIDFDVIVTDYVANGSFASLAENVTYIREVDYAKLIRLTDYNKDFNGDFVYVDEKAYEFLGKSKLLGGEVIISNVGAYAGTVFRCPKLDSPMTLGPNSIVLKSKFNNYFYLLFTSRLGKHILNSIITGSAQPKFNKTAFRNIFISFPDTGYIEQFELMITPFMSKIEQNSNQIQSLNKTRDTLLPKLMSG